MTTTQRNYTGQKARKTVSILLDGVDQYMSSFAVTGFWTRQRMDNFIRSRTYENKEYNRLPERHRVEVDTTFQLYRYLHQRAVWGTHVLDGVRMGHNDPRTKNRAREIFENDQVNRTSCECYAVQMFDMSGNLLKNLYVPFDDDFRQAEIESGRITTGDMERILAPEMNHVKLNVLIRSRGSLTHRNCTECYEPNFVSTPATTK